MPTAADIAALASTPIVEYARAENARLRAAGSTYQMVEDPAYYADRGVTTAAEWELDMLRSEYSDLYKEVHGFRPRGHGLHTAEDLIAAVDDLVSYTRKCAEREVVEAAAEAARVAAAMRVEPLTHRPFAALGR